MLLVFLWPWSTHIHSKLAVTEGIYLLSDKIIHVQKKIHNKSSDANGMDYPAVHDRVPESDNNY